MKPSYLSASLQKVYDLAVEGHSRFNALDKGGLALYHWHLARVAIRLGPSALEEEKKVALCHDLLEDTDITLEDLKNVGLTPAAIEAVQLCSNIYYKDITHKAWMETIGNNQNVWGKKIKLADLADNHSFERMLGLDNAFRQERLATQTSLPKKIKPVPNLSQRVFKKIDGSMKKKAHAGLWGRYLKDMDILLLNKDSAIWAQDINTSSFGRYEEYRELYSYLGSQEFIDYQQKQNVQGLRVLCEVALLRDRAGQAYVGAWVEPHIAQVYQASLREIDASAESLIAQQLARDKGHQHITILSAQEYGKTLKEAVPAKVALIENMIGQKEVFDFYSIGKLTETFTPKQSAATVPNRVYYALCENGRVQSLRQALGFADKDLHATLGFEHKDIFNQRKNLATKTCSFSVVWKNIEQQFKHELEHNPSVIVLPKNSRF